MFLIVELISVCIKAALTLAVALFRTLTFFMPNSYKDIREDVVLITGGGRGIGRLIAAEFAKRKPKQIVLWGRHDDTLSATARAIQLKGVSCSYMVCDVGSREQVIAKSEEVKQQFGGVDILVNNAAVLCGGSVLDVNPDELERTVDVNLLAQFWTIKAFLPGMQRRNHGHVVSINSILGLIALPGASDYSTSKFGSTGLYETLSMELSRDGYDGIKVTTIHPYQFDTEMFAGVKLRFPSLFPSLDKNYVAWKIVNAVCTEQKFCIIPRSMYFFYYLKCMLPYETLQVLQKFTGMDKAMDQWHGSYAKRRFVKPSLRFK